MLSSTAVSAPVLDADDRCSHLKLCVEVCHPLQCPTLLSTRHTMVGHRGHRRHDLLNYYSTEHLLFYSLRIDEDYTDLSYSLLYVELLS
ncbi:hypothetical protein ACF0H5_022577 [Mactra antiquata]